MISLLGNGSRPSCLRAQSLDCSDEHQIRRARAEAWPRRHNEKFAGLKMRRRLQPDLCEMRNRITATLRHLFDLLENQVVVVSSQRDLQCEAKDRHHNTKARFFHGG